MESFRVSSSRHLVSWLNENRTSIAFTTYQAGRLFFIGTNASGELSAFERAFPRCMGLWTDGQTIWLSSTYQIWRLENSLGEGETADGYDRCFVPRVGYVTGDLDVHDLVGRGDEALFVNSLHSCLATTSHRFSFHPVWQPSWISALVPEDRCHLNGLAMRDGQPGFVTACSQSDAVESWRGHREHGGVVVDIQDNTVVGEGLSMPHSPRWHGNRIWVLNSGSGFLGFVDLKTGAFEEVCFCPGFSRGLAFVGKYAIVGLSECRKERTFDGLELDRSLERRKTAPFCGLLVIDTEAGNIEHWLRIEGVVHELYDVVAVPGAKRPKALGFKTDEISRHISMAENQ
ncbi:TIGR03032 family protein [Aeoliella sp. SH292]|uniref:TIGR03032 family protein n=1 Tax=Aeoliella sp. SH292 TaxID=3454464 RepID=UPI003F962D96